MYMSASAIFLGILPLLAFVLIDSFAGLKSGVIAAIAFALAETAYTLFIYQTIDSLTVGSTVLVLVFGVLSLKSNNAIYLKLQPVVLGVAFGLVLLVMQLLNQPLLVMMVEKYQFMVPEELRSQLIHKTYLTMLARLSGILGFGFLIHAGLVAYSAFYMSKWWWLVFRGIGLYIMLFACGIYIRFT